MPNCWGCFEEGKKNVKLSFPRKSGIGITCSLRTLKGKIPKKLQSLRISKSCTTNECGISVFLKAFVPN